MQELHVATEREVDFVFSPMDCIQWAYNQLRGAKSLWNKWNYSVHINVINPGVVALNFFVEDRSFAVVLHDVHGHGTCDITYIPAKHFVMDQEVHKFPGPVLERLLEFVEKNHI